MSAQAKAARAAQNGCGLGYSDPAKVRIVLYCDAVMSDHDQCLFPQSSSASSVAPESPLHCGILARSLSAMGLGCVKTPTLAARVETSRRNCVPESQIILHTRGVMPSWRIVFSTVRDCMSFYTARVIFVRLARSRRSRHVRFAPKADKRRLASLCPLCAVSAAGLSSPRGTRRFPRHHCNKPNAATHQWRT